MTDQITHPTHYVSHPSGLECIDVVRSLNFLVGNAVKYCWRAGQKGDRLEDLRKARQYLMWAIEDECQTDATGSSNAFLGWLRLDWLRSDESDNDYRAEDEVIYWILDNDLDGALFVLDELIVTDELR